MCVRLLLKVWGMKVCCLLNRVRVWAHGWCGRLGGLSVAVSEVGVGHCCGQRGMYQSCGTLVPV